MADAMQTEVLIIGGGLAGCATAYYLAREGVEVTLIERFDLNTQASGCNSGSLHAQIPHEPFVDLGEDWARTFAPTLPLMLESIRLWRGLESELACDLEVSLRGGILVAETEAQMRGVERKAALERAHGLEVEILSRDDLRRVAPYVSDRMVGGALCPAEGKANPLKAAPAFAAAARRQGARILCGRALASLAADGDHYVAETSGGPIRARRVVNCGGAEAGPISALLGLPLPIEGHPIQVNVTEPMAPFVEHLVYFAGEKLTLKQAGNGSLLIGGGWPARWSARDGRAVVDPDSLRANLRVAQTVVPGLASVRLIRVWPAVVNGTADWKPILGEAPGLPGFFLNIFPWMGFSAGPIAARITAELVMGRKPGWDLAPFSALRYAA
ncbi:MAG: FAD-binding oxidoreductase [Alphaproteobacteria bacterium]|nr:FAD-binding oxidoreductase [Alphaproteobacteria bacterium]